MANISLLPQGFGGLEDRQGQSGSINLRGKLVQAYQAVIQENRAAAVDTSELTQTTQAAGQFVFDLLSGDDTASAQVSWQGGFSSSVQQGEQTTNFSFSFSISARFEVSFASDITADEESITGNDFSLTREGELTLSDELAQRVGSDSSETLDLTGALSDQLVSVLEKLGLLDSDGKATPALQLFSDYAGLGRFTAGQQVGNSQGLQYSQSYSARVLSWQSWSQRLNETETQQDATNVIDFLKQVSGGDE